jgi:hypothetical protein
VREWESESESESESLIKCILVLLKVIDCYFGC